MTIRNAMISMTFRSVSYVSRNKHAQMTRRSTVSRSDCDRVPRTRFAAVALVAVAVVGLMSDRCDASCGDYLFRGGKPVSHAGHAGMVQETDHLLFPDQQMPTRRCSGPHCSSSPFSPVAPASPVQVKFRMESANPGDSRNGGNGDGGDMPLPASESATSAERGRLFRPPRCV